MEETLGHIYKGEFYRKKLTRPEGFKSPTFGFEVRVGIQFKF